MFGLVCYLIALYSNSIESNANNENNENNTVMHFSSYRANLFMNTHIMLGIKKSAVL